MPVYWSEWEAYPWKNELKVQLERVLIHCREILQEDYYSGTHDPHNMLETAIVLAGFCIRRLIEKRLVTDAIAKSTISLRTYPADQKDFRMPFHRSAGGDAFTNYLCSAPMLSSLTLKGLADELIHSSQLMIVGGEPAIQDGLLIVSDWRLKKRAIHLTPGEFSAIAQTVLDNHVVVSSDRRDWNSNTVSSTRF